MKVRIKLKPQSGGPEMTGFASDEHPGATAGLPEILIDGKVLPSPAWGYTVITSGKLIAERLRMSGYDVRVTQARASYM